MGSECFVTNELWVVKLGGSLAASIHLTSWLEALSQTNVIIVPGGGSFADAVRKAQQCWHFDDRTAHDMAILAMEQYGRMLVGLCPKLLATLNLEDLSQPMGGAKVWLPRPEVLDEAGVPATWDITSDSLAAWLAGKMSAKHLLLVKSLIELDNMADTAREVCFTLAADSGWVDPAFNRYAITQDFQSWLCGPLAHASLPQAFSKPLNTFTRLRQ